MSAGAKITLIHIIIGLVLTGIGALLLYGIFSKKIKSEDSHFGNRTFGSLIVFAFALTIGGIAWLILTFVDPYWLSSA